MKAPHRTAFCTMRMIVLLTASVLLVQCTMPQRQAWQYIQTHGLVNYWAYSLKHGSSPPFRTSPRSNSLYASSVSSSYPQYYQLANNGFSLWGSGMPNRIPYSYNRYYDNASGPRYFGDTYPSRSAPPSQPSDPPSIRLPVNEPAPAPQVAHQPTASPSPTPPANGNPLVAKTGGELPFGILVPGRPNMVYSPFAGKTQLVDVSGMGAGQTVKCPYTGKLFKVPGAQQAANEKRNESKLETPNLSSEPKPENKKP